MALSRVEIELDQGLVDEAIRRYHLGSARDAVNLALRTLINESANADSSLDDEEVDEFSDLRALRRPRPSESA